MYANTHRVNVPNSQWQHPEKLKNVHEHWQNKLRTSSFTFVLLKKKGCGSFSEGFVRIVLTECQTSFATLFWRYSRFICCCFCCWSCTISPGYFCASFGPGYAGRRYISLMRPLLMVNNIWVIYLVVRNLLIV